MTRYVFDKIATKRTKKYIDEDGKKRQKTKEFWQTQNPFNKGKDGLPKSVEQIREEIEKEAEAWMKSNAID